ncbi:hypothetical protein L1987_27874 [Smallanthus sonchifolius]|uniref:Uncharacterized protein n=1 Tax=Smallanthus sonchifolius TaxID=185202 RepID=A0ACB9ID82_9ASTR|nr:hypothetical protein L1987_27874 [Smallanthus sonchifolius]
MSDVLLPQEVLVSILLRLPVKSLLQFRSVSKSLCALTDKIVSFCQSSSATIHENRQNCQGVCVNGALHLLVNHIPDPAKHNLMVSYDLASQIFQLVPQPEYPDDYLSMDLGVLGGCLCVVCKRETYNVDIWVMRSRDVAIATVIPVEAIKPFNPHRRFVAVDGAEVSPFPDDEDEDDI